MNETEHFDFNRLNPQDHIETPNNRGMRRLPYILWIFGILIARNLAMWIMGVFDDIALNDPLIIVKLPATYWIIGAITSCAFFGLSLARAINAQRGYFIAIGQLVLFTIFPPIGFAMIYLMCVRSKPASGA